MHVCCKTAGPSWGPRPARLWRSRCAPFLVAHARRRAKSRARLRPSWRLRASDGATLGLRWRPACPPSRGWASPRRTCVTAVISGVEQAPLSAPPRLQVHNGPLCSTAATSGGQWPCWGTGCVAKKGIPAALAQLCGRAMAAPAVLPMPLIVILCAAVLSWAPGGLLLAGALAGLHAEGQAKGGQEVQLCVSLSQPQGGQPLLCHALPRTGDAFCLSLSVCSGQPTSAPSTCLICHVTTLPCALAHLFLLFCHPHPALQPCRK